MKGKGKSKGKGPSKRKAKAAAATIASTSHRPLMPLLQKGAAAVPYRTGRLLLSVPLACFRVYKKSGDRNLSIALESCAVK